MKQRDVDLAIRLEQRMAAGATLSGSEWRRYRKIVTRMRREKGIATRGHVLPGHQRRAEDGPALAVIDREGRLVPVGQGRRGRA